MQVKSLCHILFFKCMQSSKGTSYQPVSNLVVYKCVINTLFLNVMLYYTRDVKNKIVHVMASHCCCLGIEAH